MKKTPEILYLLLLLKIHYNKFLYKSQQTIDYKTILFHYLIMEPLYRPSPLKLQLDGDGRVTSIEIPPPAVYISPAAAQTSAGSSSPLKSWELPGLNDEERKQAEEEAYIDLHRNEPTEWNSGIPSSVTQRKALYDRNPHLRMQQKNRTSAIKVAAAFAVTAVLYGGYNASQEMIETLFRF